MISIGVIPLTLFFVFKRLDKREKIIYNVPTSRYGKIIQ